MKEKVLTAKMIAEFLEHLILGKRSTAMIAPIFAMLLSAIRPQAKSIEKMNRLHKHNKAG